MTETDELAATLDSIRRAFETLRVTWAVGGSLASAAYGEPRATNDVDVRQFRDIVAVLRGGALDDAYLDETAKATGLDALLARARTDARE